MTFGIPILKRFGAPRPLEPSALRVRLFDDLEADRVAHEWSQEQLAAHLGISPAYWSMLRHGTKPLAKAGDFALGIVVRYPALVAELRGAIAAEGEP